MDSGPSRLISILRRITLAVQVFPFVYSALFLILFIAYSFCSGRVLDIIDNLVIDAAINWLDDDDNPYGTEKAWKYLNQPNSF